MRFRPFFSNQLLSNFFDFFTDCTSTNGHILRMKAHVALLNAFAGKGDLPAEERFSLAEWQTLATGAPVLSTARVALDCRVTEISEVGTHSVIFGEIVALSLGERGPALIYLDRAYHRI